MAESSSAPASDVGAAPLRQTALHTLHGALGGKMVPFAGYDMPVQYPLGILGEHKHTRDAAGLFDVSHMGQVILRGADHETVAAALEQVVPGEIQKLAPGRMRYTVLLNDNGGILDDLMVTRLEADGTLFVVLNAACKDDDLAYLRDRLPDTVAIDVLEDASLLALQGPKAADVMADLMGGASDLRFMQAAQTQIKDIPVLMTRSGYTGEDGFELSVPNAQAEAFANMLLASEHVEAIGLGARDSLRLEAGLCLYGNDIWADTTPIEADLGFVLGKRRREAADFPGAARILGQLADGPPRKRVAIVPEGKAPARAGTAITMADGEPLGQVTSGTFAPSVGGPIAMGYVASAYAEPGTPLHLMVRGQARPAQVVTSPFVPHRYFRG